MAYYNIEDWTFGLLTPKLHDTQPTRFQGNMDIRRLSAIRARLSLLAIDPHPCQVGGVSTGVTIHPLV